MRYLYNTAYLVLLAFLAPVLIYRAARHGKYREGWEAKLWGRVPQRSRGVERLWLHAVSVGEVNLLPGVVRDLTERFPGAEIVVSTTTATGMQLARRLFGDASVFYCPLDFSWSVERTLDRVAPAMLILTELELWPNLIQLARRRGIPVAVINARLSAKSFRGYRRLGWLVRNVLRQVNRFVAQDEETARRFLDLGVMEPALRITGSIKFDGAPTVRDTPEIAHLRRLTGAREMTRIWMCGSTIDPEEEGCLRVYRQLMDDAPELRLVLVPRHPERFDTVARRIEELGFVCRRRSWMEQAVTTWHAREVVLVDTVGELKSWWGLADVAFVGGSMGNRGGQNMLEPAGYGAAVCFGPDTKNFREIAERLIACGGARRVDDFAALEQFVRDMLRSPETAQAMGQAARQLVLSGRGATARTGEILAALRAA